MNELVDTIGTPIVVVLVLGMALGVVWIALISAYSAFAKLKYLYARARRLRVDKARWFRK